MQIGRAVDGHPHEATAGCVVDDRNSHAIDPLMVISAVESL